MPKIAAQEGPPRFPGVAEPAITPECFGEVLIHRLQDIWRAFSCRRYFRDAHADLPFGIPAPVREKTRAAPTKEPPGLAASLARSWAACSRSGDSEQSLARCQNLQHFAKRINPSLFRDDPASIRDRENFFLRGRNEQVDPDLPQRRVAVEGSFERRPAASDFTAAARFDCAWHIPRPDVE